MCGSRMALQCAAEQWCLPGVWVQVTTKGFEELKGQRNVNFTRRMEEQVGAWAPTATTQ